MFGFGKQENDYHLLYIEKGDAISYDDGNIHHGGHDVIGFDLQGNPIVDCDGHTIVVPIEQVERVYK